MLILFKEDNPNRGVFNLIFFFGFGYEDLWDTLFLACIGQHYFSEYKMHCGFRHNIANMLFINYMV